MSVLGSSFEVGKSEPKTLGLVIKATVFCISFRGQEKFREKISSLIEHGAIPMCTSIA